MRNDRMCHISKPRSVLIAPFHRSSPNSTYTNSNMKLLVVLALVAAACAVPQQYPQDVQILRYDNDNSGLNFYKYGFELSDGTKREEQGQLKNEGSENEALTVQGSYAWRGPDGVDYLVTYIADENGFQPQIQQGPGGGVPPAVVASLLG